MRERQEFLDRYFVFGTHDYHPTLDYSRTRGLVSEIMKQVTSLHHDKQLAEDLANQPSPEHIPRIAIGSAMRRNLPDTTGPEAGDTVIEGGTQTTPTSPQGATPPSATPGVIDTGTPGALPAVPTPGASNNGVQDSNVIAPGSSGNAAGGGGANSGSRNNALTPGNNALSPNNDALAPANDQLAPVNGATTAPPTQVPTPPTSEPAAPPPPQP